MLWNHPRVKCDDCGALPGRPCVDEDGALYGYHASRARLETRSQIASNAAEASRLRAAQKGAGK